MISWWMSSNLGTSSAATRPIPHSVQTPTPDPGRGLRRRGVDVPGLCGGRAVSLIVRVVGDPNGAAVVHPDRAAEGTEQQAPEQSSAPGSEDPRAGSERVRRQAVPAPPDSSTAARPASRRATGTRNGEHDT